MSEKPTLYVCHGDMSGGPLHPCRRVQTAFDKAGIEYEKVIGGRGSPLPWKTPPRERVIADTGQDNLPTLRLADGTIIAPSKAILGWVKQQA